LSSPGLRGERLVLRSHEDSRPQTPSRAWRALSALSVVSGLSAASAQSVELLETFRKLDADGDGKIDLDEFCVLVGGENMARGRGVADATRKDAVAYFTRLHHYADIDGDEKLSPQELEYAEYLSAHGAHERTVLKVAEAAKKSIHAEAHPLDPGSSAWPVVPDEFATEYAAAIVADHDTDGDGSLSREEYDAGMRASSVVWGWEHILDDPEVLAWYDDLFAKGDIDGDGSLGLRESHYVALVSDRVFRSRAFSTKLILGVLFDEMDPDKNGRIEKEEVMQMVALVNAGRAELEDIGETFADVVLKHFDEVDADGDGALDREEAGTLASILDKVLE